MSNVEEKGNVGKSSASQSLPKPSTMKTGVLRPSLLKLQQTEHSTVFSSTFTESSNQPSSTGSNNDKIGIPSALTKNTLPGQNFTMSNMPAAKSHDFVFGQNIHERVTGEHAKEDDDNKDNEKEPCGTTFSNMLFSSALHNVKPCVETNEKETDTHSLTEAARLYEESKAQKRKYDAVETFTGEENEVNVAEVNCKLFAFIKGNWEERGRGSLRLNDARDEASSRVVFRTAGNFRLLLNTKIWPEMVVQKPSPKSLRLTAIDSSGLIKIFLVMAHPNDISTLYTALKERVTLCSNENSNEMEQNGTANSRANEKSNEHLNDEPSPKKAHVSD